MTAPAPTTASARPPVRLAYVVSHPIQYQAPLLRRIASQPDIDLTVFFGSDLSLRAYKDEGFGVQVAWDVPLLDGYRSEFLPTLRFLGKTFSGERITATSPISRGLYSRLQNPDGSPRFDVLWSHGYASVNAFQAILAANALGIPVLLRADMWLADRRRSPLKLALKQLFFHALEPAIAGVLPVGTASAAYWHHYFGDRVPQFLMPYAVDNAYFARLAAAATPRRNELRAELHLDADRPVILFASKLQTRKNADHLVRAYRTLLDRSPGSRPYLVIVGDGEERAALETLVAELDLTADVRFAGFRNQSELPRFFDLASVFVLPSRHEPWGLIVNEAMATGCPVIVASDVGAAFDLIGNDLQGYIYPTGDIPALTTCLEQVFATPDTARTLGENARARMQTWSFDQDIAALRRALSHLTGKIAG
jgi:glycosyltransferase involved in cell wall biosynthesis